MFLDIHFVLQKSTNPQSKQSGLQETCTEMCRTVTFGLQSASPHFSRDVKGECFAKLAEICTLLASLRDREAENLDDHGCPKIRCLVDEKRWSCTRYPFRHTTVLHCAERKAKLLSS